MLTFFTQAIILLFGFIINKLLSIELNIENYGTYCIIKRTSSVIAFTNLCGMGIALPRYLSYYIAQDKKQQICATILVSLCIITILSLIISIILLFAKNNLYHIITGINNSSLYFVTILFAISISFSTFIYSYYRGNGNFVKYCILQIAVQVLFLLSFLVYRQDLFILLLLWSFSAVFATILIFLRDVRKNIHGRFINKIILRDTTKNLLIYGSPRLLGDFIWFSFNAIPLVLINLKLGITETSYFSVGITLNNIITPFFGFIGTILLPYASEAFAKNERNKLKVIICKLLITYCVISVIVSFLFYYEGDLLIKILFSEKYLESWQICQIIIWTILPNSIYLLLRNPLDAISKIPYNTINLVISISILIILFYYSSTLQDYAISMIISYSILALLSLSSWQYLHKTSNKHIFQ